MIILTCDHGGFVLTEKIKFYLDKIGEKYKYVGPQTFDKNDDYPDFVFPAVDAVLKNKKNIGIFVCGSGVGVSMVANRFKGIRAVCANDIRLAYLARKDEDANVLTMGGKFVSESRAKKIISKFLSTDFEGGRHARRIAKYN